MALPPNSQAPEFKGTDSNAKQHDLAQYRGKWVVLEWANRGCPYEQNQYLSGNMESLQREWRGKGVVWFSVISSAPGQQEYATAAEENEYLKQMKAAPAAALLDPQGAIGHLYAARTTPHMFVIDPTGKIVYQGAIDNRPSPDPETLKGPDNYLNDALRAGITGKPVVVAANATVRLLREIRPVTPIFAPPRGYHETGQAAFAVEIRGRESAVAHKTGVKQGKSCRRPGYLICVDLW